MSLKSNPLTDDPLKSNVFVGGGLQEGNGGGPAPATLLSAVTDLYGPSDLGDVFPFYDPSTLNVTDSGASANVTVYNGTEACGRYQGVRTTGTPLFASQPNAARRFTANTIDGHDGLIAMGNEDCIFGSTALASAPVTHFYQIRTGSSFTASTKYHMFVADDPVSIVNYQVSMNNSANIGQAYGGSFLNSMLLAANTMYYITYIYDGVSAELWINGVLRNTGDVGSLSGFDVFSLGYLNVGSNAPTQMTFAKKGWIDRAVLTAERETIEAYTSATGAG